MTLSFNFLSVLYWARQVGTHTPELDEERYSETLLLRAAVTEETTTQRNGPTDEHWTRVKA